MYSGIYKQIRHYLKPRDNFQFEKSKSGPSDSQQRTQLVLCPLLLMITLHVIVFKTFSAKIEATMT
jgi:hypothetical protein